MKRKGGGTVAMLMRSSWTFLLLLFCYGFYLHGIEKKRGELALLTSKTEALELELYSALEKREDLLLQVDSHSDPAWIEMCIKERLGMVPSGQIKIYFETE